MILLHSLGQRASEPKDKEILENCKHVSLKQLHMNMNESILLRRRVLLHVIIILWVPYDSFLRSVKQSVVLHACFGL